MGVKDQRERVTHSRKSLGFSKKQPQLDDLSSKLDNLSSKYEGIKACTSRRGDVGHRCSAPCIQTMPVCQPLVFTEQGRKASEGEIHPTHPPQKKNGKFVCIKFELCIDAFSLAFAIGGREQWWWFLFFKIWSLKSCEGVVSRASIPSPLCILLSI